VIASKEAVVPAIVVRNLTPETHAALKARAKRNGRSTEAEVRHILGAAVDTPDISEGLGAAIVRIAQELGVTEDDHRALAAALDEVRDRSVPEPIRFE
jgi:antitoxin FitA